MVRSIRFNTFAGINQLLLPCLGLDIHAVKHHFAIVPEAYDCDIQVCTGRTDIRQSLQAIYRYIIRICTVNRLASIKKDDQFVHFFMIRTVCTDREYA